MFNQRRRLSHWRWTIAAGSLLLLECSATAGADVAASPDTRDPSPAHRVVLRLSEEMLNTLLGSQDVDRQTGVREVILGTAVYGQSRVTGQHRVQLAENGEQATFFLIFQGAAHSRTTGYNGPAIIYSRTITTFTATKQIVLEPGQGFQALPSQVTARSQTFVEGIDSTRGGLIGRIVRRRAARTEAALHAEATEIARQKAARRIAAALDRTSEARLARLNGVSQFQNVAAAALSAGRSGQPKYACCTTPHYLQIATSFGSGGSPIELPVEDASDAAGAPIEIWFHETLVGDGTLAAIDLMTTPTSVADFLKAISTAAQVIGGNQDPSSPLAPLLSEQPVRIRKTGDWRVIAVEMPADASPAIARAPAPRIMPQQPAPAAPTPTVPSSAAPAPAAIAQLAPAPGPAAEPADPPRNRIWTSGPYHADAQFLALEGNMVRLLRTTGVRTSIPIEKLSPADQTWIREYLAAR
jgi:hypothetical protein